MKVFILNQEQPYDPYGKNRLRPSNMILEEAIKAFAGNETIFIQWKDDDGTENQIVITTNEDNNRIADKIASRIFMQLKAAIISSK